MRRLGIDLETYSSVKLDECGVYAYTQSPDFEIVLCSFSLDGKPIETLQSEEEILNHAEFLSALFDSDVEKTAWNANFERVCLGALLKKQLDPLQWSCSMILAQYQGYPASLKDAGEALGVSNQKLDTGRDLIRFFCQPDRKGQRRRPEDYPEKWAEFIRYNVRDVEAEMEIRARLDARPLPRREQELYALDQRINDRGIALDEEFIQAAIAMNEKFSEEMLELAREITWLENPNSVAQLKGWIQAVEGFTPASLGKKEIEEVYKRAKNPRVKKMLDLRPLLAKTSVAKYKKMEHAMGNDGRARGLLRFYGASRSGRWAGRLIQVQNLPRNNLEELAEVRDLVKAGDLESLELVYDNPSDILSQLVRTALIPSPGCRFIVSDYSAIEARVLAWLAGEGWRMELFATGGDIYCQSATQMFGVPVVKHGINGELRQKGKIAELACIAEGELVLTDQGLVPIENVTKSQRVWDGEEWVHHGGVVYKGVREVISYEGLKATPDHLVWVEGQSGPIQFGEAAKSGAHLLQTGDGRQAVKRGEDRLQGKARVYDIRNAGKHHRFTVSGKLVHNCGYGGSLGALKAMGGLEMGLSPEELQSIVAKWRAANPKIVRIWAEFEEKALAAVNNPCRIASVQGISMKREGDTLFIRLPSGRDLAYAGVKIGENRFGLPCITYMDQNQTTRKWQRTDTYGGKLTENITQAIARDVLANAMKRLDSLGYQIVMHVHDEVVVDVPNSQKEALQEINRIMGEPIPWAPGLLLTADGYECPYYQKD